MSLAWAGLTQTKGGWLHGCSSLLGEVRWNSDLGWVFLRTASLLPAAFLSVMISSRMSLSGSDWNPGNRRAKSVVLNYIQDAIGLALYPGINYTNKYYTIQ